MASLGEGFRVGHWSHGEARTGCTVVLPPGRNVSSCDIRGSSPSSRELALLDPDRRLTEVHAVLLTGGSAFGLAAAEGVVEWLADKGVGYETRIVPVPIVPAAVIFDLGVGSAHVRPGRSEGWAACDGATETDVATGPVGAGTGATVGKWAGPEFGVPGGVGIATAERDGARASALAIVNSVGDVIAGDGSTIAGTTSPAPDYRSPLPSEGEVPTSTVLALVAIRANLDKRDVRFLAARGSDGITNSVRPAHTRYDGDVVFAVAARDETGQEANVDVLGHLATEAVAAAVRNAVS